MIDTSKLKTDINALGVDTRAWHSKRDFRDMDRTEFVEAMKTKYEYLFTNSLMSS